MDGKIIITKLYNHTITSYFDSTGEITEISCEKESKESILNNIYIGRVKDIAKNINAAFVEFEKGSVGYLPLEKCKKKIKEGDCLLVQIEKDNVKSKFPVISSDFSLTGKYVVLITENNNLHYSSKIKDKKTLDRLAVIGEKYSSKDYGLIFRTNSKSAQNEEIENEINNLINIKNEILSKEKHLKEFSVVYKSPKLYIKEIIDSYDQNISEIVTDKIDIYKEVKEYLEECDIKTLEKLKFYNDELLPLNKLYSIEKNLKDSLKSKVWLRSGAYLVIQPTEALVVIDVNSGKNTNKKSKREQFLNINKESAKEIARQLRLRNLSGIIIVDFINMEYEEDKKELLSELEFHLKKDHIKTSLVGMTKLNLVEITRKKIKKPLYEQINEIII